MATIHYCVHGRGRGHATRSLPILAALRAGGYRVDLAAGEDALPILQDPGPCRAVRSLMPGMGPRLLPLLFTRLLETASLLHRSGAELVISDGDLPALLGARLLGLPAIAVGHAESFSRCRRPPGVPRGPWWRVALRAWISAPIATRHIAVNFIGLESRSPRTSVARPAVDSLPASPSGSRTRVVCYFRDANGGDVLRALVAGGERPLLFAAGPSGVAGVERQPIDRRAFLAALATARAVVGSAGSQLISECVHHAIPVFACYRDGDDEQLLNVSMLRAAGLGDGCALSRFDAERLRAFLAGAGAGESRRAAARPVMDVVAAVLAAVRECLGRGDERREAVAAPTGRVCGEVERA